MTGAGIVRGWQEGAEHPLLIVQYPWGSRGGYLHPVTEQVLRVLAALRQGRIAR